MDDEFWGSKYEAGISMIFKKSGKDTGRCAKEHLDGSKGARCRRVTEGSAVKHRLAQIVVRIQIYLREIRVKHAVMFQSLQQEWYQRPGYSLFIMGILLAEFLGQDALFGTRLDVECE